MMRNPDRIRTDPAFALEVFSKIQTRVGREIFVQRYGMPKGGENIPLPKGPSIEEAVNTLERLSRN